MIATQSKCIRFVLLALLSFAGQLSGQEWETSGQFKAREAFQAAAADDDFVYAINSNQVAKYDRGGERIAISQGEAHHLNSGFLLGGNLYCAHSNYPGIPEQSQIKVLDVNTMQLETFKDFGDDYVGSLTWVVRHNDHWWCNFARYKDKKAETFLAKFDMDWHEQARWNYPDQVLEGLGEFSISGGVWRENELLVTGHHEKVLFRLTLPEAGNELAYAGYYRVPFTGQGIAIDPKSGGMVGIIRWPSQIVFASPPRLTQLRVLTYNIHHGEGIDRKLDLERIAKVILSVKPDLVALQEIDNRAGRSKSVDQASELAKLTSMNGVFGGNIDFQGGKYGNAFLSRFPIRKYQNHQLPRFDESEQRGVLEIEVALPGCDQPLIFLATHLDHRRPDRERIASAVAINKLIGDRGPALLAGDLNDGPRSQTLKMFEKKWTHANERVLPTVPVTEPTRQIDYILYRSKDQWHVVESKVLDEAVASDHRALLSVLKLTERSIKE